MPTCNIHIVTVGASVLTKFAKSDAAKSIALPAPDDDPAFATILKDKSAMEKIADFVRSTPYTASAELNAMQPFLNEKSVHEVYLILTDTNQCEICGRAIHDCLNSMGIRKVDSTRIQGYYSRTENTTPNQAADLFVKDLGRLRDNLVAFIRRRSKDPQNRILINATGGFKAEIVILALVGSMMDARVYYRHEFFRETVFLPPLIFFAKFPQEMNMLQELAQRPDGRITRHEVPDFRKRFTDALDRPVRFNLIELKEREGVTYEIKITPTGKFVVETYRKLYEK